MAFQRKLALNSSPLNLEPRTSSKKRSVNLCRDPIAVVVQSFEDCRGLSMSDEPYESKSAAILALQLSEHRLGIIVV